MFVCLRCQEGVIKVKDLKMRECLTGYGVALLFVIAGRLVGIQCQNNETQKRDRVVAPIVPIEATVMPSHRLKPLQPVNVREFPISELFNLTTLVSTISRYQCTARYSYFEEKHCQCTKDCMKSRSCCIDVDWNKNSPVSSKIYIQSLLDKAKRYKKLSCRKVIDVDKQESETYYMVTTCLRGSNITDQEKCSENSDDLYDSMPVLGNAGYLYKNAHCATCNFVEKYEHVNITGRCVANPMLPTGRHLTKEDFSRFSQCLFTISSTQNKKLPACKPQTFCTTENRTLYELCHAYEAPLSIPKYKNYHCFLCDKQSNKSLNVHTILTTDLDYCLRNFCHLPNGEDSTKYESIFNIILDSNKHVVISGLKQKFPIRQFLNISLDYIFPKDNGLEQYLCTSFNNREKCCQCNPDCIIDKKCCIDAFWNETSPLPVDLYLQTFAKRYNQIKEYTCEPVYPHAKTLGHETEYRFMVRSCAKFKSFEDAANCFNSSNVSTAGNIIPVFGSDGNLYANAFCARCNMVFDYVYTNVTMDCKNVLLISEHELIVKGNQTVFIRPTECRFRMIHDNFYKSKRCNVYENIPNRECTNGKNDENYELCNYYYGKFGVYANYHCWKCNNRDVSTMPFISLIKYCDKTCIDCGVPNTRLVVTSSKERTDLHSFTISFSSGVSKVEGYSSRRTTCQNRETFDFKEFKCVKVTCPPNYQLIDVICERTLRPNAVSVFSTVEDATHKKCLVARDSVLYVIFSDTYTNRTTFLNQFKNAYLVVNATFQLKYSKKNTSIYKTDGKVTIELMRNLEVNLVNSPILRNEKVNIVITMNIDSSVISSTYGLDPFRIYPDHRHCSKSKRLIVDTVQFTNNSCDVTSHNKHYQNNATSFWISFFNGTATENIAVCDQFHLFSSCARKVLTENTNIDSDNNTLIHTHSNGVDTYQPHEYTPVTDGYSVCVTVTDPYNTSSSIRSSKFEQLYTTAYYISMVATCIGCVCYVWIIATYLLFSELRTIPGFNNIFMCLSLFISDVLYLASIGANDYTKACTGIAIVRHWSSLCAFMWTVVIASDLVSRFGSFSVASHDRYIQRVVWRCLFAFLIPTVVVIVAVILDTSSKVNIGYGSEGICWITNLYARVGFYIVPVACISLFTFLALVYTLSKIYKDKKGVEKVLKRDKKSRKSFAEIALKLVIILGLTEFIGFVQIPGAVLSENEEIVNAIFRFLYSILRSFRGIMLWFVYILGGHVMKKYKKRFIKSSINNGVRASHSRNVSGDGQFQSHTSNTSTTSV